MSPKKRGCRLLNTGWGIRTIFAGLRFSILTCSVIRGVEVEPLVEPVALTVRTLRKNKKRRGADPTTAFDAPRSTRRNNSTRRTKAHDATKTRDAREDTTHKKHGVALSSAADKDRTHTYITHSENKSTGFVAPKTHAPFAASATHYSRF